MATLNGSVKVEYQQQWQNLSGRSNSPTSPQVLSRPTTSKRKNSVPTAAQQAMPSNGGGPVQHVAFSNSLSRWQYSTNSLNRPIHSKYSSSQPHLNVAGVNVTLRSRSNTDGNPEQSNRWSIVSAEENPGSQFASEALRKGYDLRLTKCSVEDLRPLPVPVVAPKVPPRRGSRLTTVRDPVQQQQNMKVDSQQLVKNHRETRSCEDLLESVSSSALSSNTPHPNGESSKYARAGSQGPSYVHGLSTSQPQTSNQSPSAVEPSPQQWVSQRDNAYSVAYGSGPMTSNAAAPSNKILVMFERSHSVGVDSNENGTSKYTPQPRSLGAPAVIMRSKSVSDYEAVHNNAQSLNQPEYCLRAAGMNGGPYSAHTLPRGSTVSVDHYQRSSPGATSTSTEYLQGNNNGQRTPGSVSNIAYPSNAGMSGTVGQHNPTLPPIDPINDANLSMTPHTSCSSPSTSPNSYRDNTETVVINIPDNQRVQDNKLTTSVHVPHYAIPVNSSTVDTRDKLAPANSAVQGSSVVQGGPYSYRVEPDRAIKSLTPSNSGTGVGSGQSQYETNRQERMSVQNVVKDYSLSQPAGTLSASTNQTSAVAAATQPQAVSQNTQVIEYAFSQWQYQGTAKRKQVSTNKQNIVIDSKPPVKPKPAALTKGISLTLKRDKSKAQKSNASGGAFSKKKSDLGSKYVFKQTKSQTLLSRGRTPSQVDPLTDVGMEVQYGSYTPQKHHQSSSGSSGDSTLRADNDLKFTDNQNGYPSPGPSPNSYDYGSQMTLMGDATLTPRPYSPLYTSDSPSAQQVSAPGSHMVQQPLQVSTNSSSPSQVSIGSQLQNGGNATVTDLIPTNEPSHSHGTMSSATPRANNGYPQLSNSGQIGSTSPSDLKPMPHLAPIAEVNLESEQSTSSLLSTKEQNDTSPNQSSSTSESIHGNGPATSTHTTAYSPSTGDSGITQSQEADSKVNPTVQRSTTLPSAYKRPKPYRFNPKKYLSKDIQEHGDDSEDYELAFSSSSIKLSDFTALNTTTFPKLIKVSSPITFTSSDVQISQGDIFDLHFVRQTKAAIAVSSQGQEFFIPLNSALKFSMTYDPLNKSQLGQQGYHFNSVSELIATREIPTVVVATESYVDSKPQSSVEAGEILVVCGVVKQAHGKMLKVTSTTNGRKFLEERCTAKFSTRSEDIKLSLNDMFKASVPLPRQAIIHPPSGLHLPDSLSNALVTLKQFCVVKSVIATPSSPQHNSPSSTAPTNIYDISLSLDVEVQECSEEMEQYTLSMRPVTQHLYSSFDPTKVNPFYSSPTRSTDQLTTQTALLRTIDKKGKFVGMQLELPEWLGQMRLNKAKRAMMQSQREPLLPRDHPAMVQGAPAELTMRMASLEKYCKRVDSKVDTLVKSFTDVVHQISKFKKKQKSTAAENENYQGFEQYVEMMLRNEERTGDRQASPDKPAEVEDVKPEAEQGKQDQSRMDDHLEGVKEWQKKQDKHLQWQQEQVQLWQIECEKQMQEMQDKLALLEDRQMKFFLETQQKLNQWKSDQEKAVAATHKEDTEKVQIKVDASNPEIPPQNKPVSKPYLLRKPSKNLQPIVSENRLTAVLTADKEPQKQVTVEPKEKTVTSESVDKDLSTSEESADFGLDMIASWCSQMELELNELYTNTVDTKQ